VTRRSPDDDQPAGGEDGRGDPGYGQCPAPSSPHRLTLRPPQAGLAILVGRRSPAVAVAGPAAPAAVAAGVQGGGGAGGAAARASVGDARRPAVPAAAGRAGVAAATRPARPIRRRWSRSHRLWIGLCSRCGRRCADVLAEPLTEAGSSAIADAKARLAASAERLVIDTGRNTIIDNVSATGRRRLGADPEPGACSFCLMLATRGAVYRSEGRRTSSRTTTAGVTSSRCSPPTSPRACPRGGGAVGVIDARQVR
jgi:hypothetical protein